MIMERAVGRVEDSCVWVLIDRFIDLAVEEVSAVIALTPDQVVNGPSHRPTMRELMRDGAEVLASGQILYDDVRLYPIGSAVAPANVLRFAAAEDGCGSWSNSEAQTSVALLMNCPSHLWSYRTFQDDACNV